MAAPWGLVRPRQAFGGLPQFSVWHTEDLRPESSVAASVCASAFFALCPRMFAVSLALTYLAVCFCRVVGCGRAAWHKSRREHCSSVCPPILASTMFPTLRAFSFATAFLAGRDTPTGAARMLVIKGRRNPAQVCPCHANAGHVAGNQARQPQSTSGQNVCWERPTISR